MSKHIIKIGVDENGFGYTLLDGRDISEMVQAIGFNTEIASPTEVTLVFGPIAVELEAGVDKLVISKKRNA
jgi:hypothetical protein